MGMEGKMLKMAICEDDPISRKVLAWLIDKYWKQKAKEQEEVQIYSYKDGKDYKEQWSIENEADILLLDIEMKSMNGIWIKEFLERQNSKTKILFITCHMEAMQEAFGANVYGFLLKPVQEEKLFAYFDKILQHIYYEVENVLVNKDGKHSCKLYKIIWIKADGRYSKIRIGDDEIFSDQSLKEWENKLEKFFFFRIHKSYLVNFKQISQIKNELVLLNGEKLPIARRKKKELKEAYKRFLLESTID